MPDPLSPLALIRSPTVSSDLEDADGSLLVIDMGSWFNYDCPTQKIAKEQVTGTIYRVRRLDAPKLEDPWGKKIEWSSLPVGKLVSLLSDARHQVAAHAVEELVKRGAASVADLTSFVKGNDAAASLARREAVYALSRINTAEARASVRAAMAHSDATVREVAAHCVSVERDAAALPALAKLVIEDTAPIRRKAAEALGRIGKVEAVPPLLASLRHRADDTFLQHSLIYALIQIGAFDETLPALNDASASVRRSALVALDQMNGFEQRGEQPASRGHALLNPHRGSTYRYLANEKLAREHIAPLLDADDAGLQLAVLEAISRRPAWARELVTVAAKWVRAPKLDEAQREAFVTALLGSAADGKVQQFIAATLLDAGIPAETRKDLFGVIARNRVQPQPQIWLDTLETTLRGTDAVAQREALNIVRIRNLTQFDKLLAELGNSGTAAPDVRLAATAILAPRTTLNAAAFDRLTANSLPLATRCCPSPPPPRSAPRSSPPRNARRSSPGSQRPDRGVRFRDLDGDGFSDLLVNNDTQNAVLLWRPDASQWQRTTFSLPAKACLVTATGADGGLRFVDLDADCDDDLVLSNGTEFWVRLYDGPEKGWATLTRHGKPTDPDALPMISRQGENMGVWFHSGKGSDDNLRHLDFAELLKGKAK